MNGESVWRATMDASWREGRWGRFLFEYVGNLDEGEEDEELLEAWPTPAERRVNHEARQLVDWFKSRMAEREIPPARERELLEGVRAVLRGGGGERSAAEVLSAVDESRSGAPVGDGAPGDEG